MLADRKHVWPVGAMSPRTDQGRRGGRLPKRIPPRRGAMRPSAAARQDEVGRRERFGDQRMTVGGRAAGVPQLTRSRADPSGRFQPPTSDDQQRSAARAEGVPEEQVGQVRYI
jgi:hypothetical protein